MSHEKLPNQITLGRLLLSVVFFVLLATAEAAPTPDVGLLVAALVVYVIAAASDVVDGYLARKWNVTSAFGRIADPFVDKVIVCGGFALLAGRNFVYPDQPVSELERSMPQWLHGGMASAVQGWMVVVLVAREFIISGIRGFSESQGLAFPATPAGKIKMVVQSVAISAIILQLAVFTHAPWAIVLKIALVWLTVAITVLSGLSYVRRASKLLMEAAGG